MTPGSIAKTLLSFLSQKEDLETQRVLSLFTQTKVSSEPKEGPVALLPLKYSSPLPKTALKIEPSTKEIVDKPKPQTLSVYVKLVDKIKKSCPELRIKPPSEIKKGGIPECDVLLLSLKNLPEVYQALTKAVDKQLALTETLVMDLELMDELLTRRFKVLLAPPFLKEWPKFMQHVKINPQSKEPFLGSSPLIFLESPENLTLHPSLKQALWQTLKTLLA